MHRFIPAMASLAGTRIAEIKVNHHARRFGQSKYGLSRMYKVLLDLSPTSGASRSRRSMPPKPRRIPFGACTLRGPISGIYWIS